LATPADAAALAPLARHDPEAPTAARGRAVTPVLVATGPAPMRVDLALDDVGVEAHENVSGIPYVDQHIQSASRSVESCQSRSAFGGSRA